MGLGAAGGGPDGATSSLGVDNDPGAAVTHQNSLITEVGLIHLEISY